MRTKLIILLIACMLVPRFMHGAQHYVTTVAEFNTALTNYVAGDEIIVAEGVYGVNGTKTITKSVIIKADPAATTKPVLSQIMFTLNTTEVSLELNGLEMYWDLENAVTPTASRYFISATSARSEERRVG